MPDTTPAAPAFDRAALELLHARYLRRDADGRAIETPYDMFRRVASHVAAVEARYGGGARE